MKRSILFGLCIILLSSFVYSIGSDLTANIIYDTENTCYGGDCVSYGAQKTIDGDDATYSYPANGFVSSSDYGGYHMQFWFDDNYTIYNFSGMWDSEPATGIQFMGSQDNCSTWVWNETFTGSWSQDVSYTFQSVGVGFANCIQVGQTSAGNYISTETLNFSGVAYGPPPPPPPENSTVTILSPSNLSSYTVDNFNITYNSSVGGSPNCSLFIDDIYTTSETYGGGNSTINSGSLSEAFHTFFIQCLNSTEDRNSSVYTILIDTTLPTIASNLEGNNTYWTYENILSLNYTDTNIYNISVVDTCNVSWTGSSLSSPFILLNTTGIVGCGIGTQQTNTTVCDLANNCLSVSYTWYSRARVNITAKDYLSNSLINFSISVNGTSYGNTTGGYYYLDGLILGDYNLTLESEGYATTSVLYNVASDYSTYEFFVYTANSLNITILEEETGVLINSSVEMRFSTDENEWTNTTATGDFFIDSLLADEYTIQFSSTGYSSRTYTLTISNSSTQSLIAYLSQNTSVTLFTVRDQDTSELLEGALGTIYRFTDGSWQPIESKYTDITGRVQFTYIEETKYKFFFSMEDYEVYIFYLDPILFSEYDIDLEPTITLNTSMDYDRIALRYYPTSFYDNQSNDFSFLIQSPYGELIDYGFNLTYPGGSTTASGVNAIGGQLDVTFNITGAGPYDQVRLDYYYTTTLSGQRDFTYFFSISYTGPYDSTMTANQDKTYGLGLFERLLITTILVIFVVGIATMTGNPIPGLGLGLFMFGFFVYIGFIPLWSVLISMFIGLVIVAAKS